MAWTPGERTSVVAGRTAAPGRWVNLLLTLAVLPLLIAGCAGDDEETVTPQAPASQTGGTVTTDLTIVSDDGKGKTETWQLTCEPAGGTHPDPAAACAALAAKGKTALPPVPKDMMCTQQFGGPQTAKITGTWNGEPVNATFSRTNGCEISRWKALKGLLPDAGDSPAR
jgi:subtilisin inhibitor-like